MSRSRNLLIILDVALSIVIATKENVGSIQAFQWW